MHIYTLSLSSLLRSEAQKSCTAGVKRVVTRNRGSKGYHGFKTCMQRRETNKRVVSIAFENGLKCLSQLEHAA